MKQHPSTKLGMLVSGVATALLATVLLAPKANAGTITVNFSQYGIGYETPFQAQSEDLLPGMITFYNTGTQVDPGIIFVDAKGSSTASAPLPTAGSDLTGTVSDTSSSNTITLGSNVYYLAVKWDGSNGGGAYYDIHTLAGDTINLGNLPSVWSSDLSPSGYELWSANAPAKTPDGGTTAALLGLGVIGLALASRSNRRVARVRS